MVAGFEAGRAVEKLLYLAVLLYSPAVRLPPSKARRTAPKFLFAEFPATRDSTLSAPCANPGARSP